jgi:sulfate transport system permease protein
MADGEARVMTPVSGIAGAPLAPTTERPAIQAGLIVLTILLLVVLLLLPLVVVFVEAFAHGLGAVVGALVEPEAIAAIELTLVVAAVSVPLNTVCGLAASASPDAAC